ncbi:juvenile hormone esterase-like [Portunus trituberculatus]|uniref:juvenile hormone esterase-like n=1 Tax=Portunus trituberculatus TaxID=210409 RepID=UPI001E1CD476|nr:juvenile hormone esterase-like [Portunus trituberculatus]
MLAVTIVTAMVAVAAAEQATVQVTLQQGAITGSREEAINGRMYYSFKSIPYAKPPVGPLRFKKPEPADPWSGVRNGSLPIPKCPQLSSRVPGAIDGQEDCLYLNVYTPKPYESNLPVMVYIHGGAFLVSSAGEGGSPAPLMQKDIVLVTMNYRLGALGFLSTGDDVLPGNLGLLDQTMALQWVQDNIRSLGGDPNQVTIFGASAGGISAHLHILSPFSRGLFKRAILQSGTALLASLEFSREGAISVSKTLKCHGEQSQQLLTCFKKATVKDLVYAQYSLGKWYGLPLTVAPRVDGSFLPNHPAILIRSGHYNNVDMIIGTVQDEGNLVTAGLFSKAGEEALQQLNDNFNKVGPILLGVTKEENPVYLARRVFLRYMSDLNVTMDDEPALTRIIGNQGFQVHGAQSAGFHARRTSRVFMYEVHHHLEQSFMTLFTNTSIERQMAGHGDDILYMFQFPEFLEPLHRPQDLHVQETFLTLWTNFASTGNPTINGDLGFRWAPVTPSDPLRYLSITTTPTMQQADRSLLNFWNCLPTKTTKLLYPELFLQDAEE